ncbi:MAG: DUF1552 domain-containing protein [Planctomycetota bacterium]|nr:MAG: DUF1552 domain-containing protein [Planctomycetota bacterium]
MKRLSRRTLLRSGSTVLALPLLDAMLPGMEPVRGPLRGGDARPARLVWIYVPNGMRIDKFAPTAAGPLTDAPPTLKPLGALLAQVTLIRGLAQDKGRANGDGPGDHARACASYLTGAQPLKAPDGRLRVALSADQIAARALGVSTRRPSLEIGCEPTVPGGQCDSGYPCAYSSNLSWITPTVPALKEFDPRAVFDRMFREGRGDETPEQREQRWKSRASVVDLVREHARRLESRVSSADRARLDEYQSGLVALEKRIQNALAGGESQVSSDLRPKGIPADAQEHVDLMFDLLALALETDSTRVATFLVANEGSNKSYASIGVPEGHHDLSHHGKELDKLDKLARLDHYHVERFARFLARLDKAREGDASVLDRTLVCFGSGLEDGNRHNHEDLPTLVAGGRSLGVAGGRVLVNERETPLCNLHLALLEKAGVACDRVGDSTQPLAL